MPRLRDATRFRYPLLVWASFLFGACDPGPSKADCYGVCGAGTQCVDSACVVAVAEPEPEPDPEPEPSARKRGRRSRKSSSAASDPSTPASAKFTPEDDSDVPQYDALKTQTLDMKAGSERLSDRVVNQHLGQLNPRLDSCIEKAALASSDPIGPGSVDLTLSIAGSGKVTSVTAKASSKLQVFGIVACVRKAVYAHKFPAFDGPAMGVDYSFKVD